MSHRSQPKSLADIPSFRIGTAAVHPGRLIVERDGVDIRLERQQMKLLVVLAARPGEVITKDELLEKAWGNIGLSDGVLHKNVSILRKALDDDSERTSSIKAIKNIGCQLIAPVRDIDGNLINPLQASNWVGRNPYVGLSAFDSSHEDVFCGRQALIAQTLHAIRRQIELERRFVLIVGSSGCGKTSLLRAGVLPRLMRGCGGDSGNGSKSVELLALSIAHCDLAAAQRGEWLQQLAGALQQWSLGGRDVFAAPSAAILAESLIERPERIADAIDEAWRRLRTQRTAKSQSSKPVRFGPKSSRSVDANAAHSTSESSEQKHDFLLLTIDHAEALVASSSDDTDALERERFEALIECVCAHPRVCVIAIVRGDYYAQLATAVPKLLARKGGDGHVDVPLPQPGEIAEMIRKPATLARLNFERHAETAARLDDVLRDTAAGQPDALPLLQHTLQALYESRGEDGTLTFAAYAAIGGLEGAIAHRADSVFTTLPEHVKQRLDTVLALLTQLETDTDRITARPVLWSSLPDEAARNLVETFIRARLFVAGHNDGSHDFRVAHEALLRQWPRARDWAQDNRRLLLARARLERAAKRWDESGKRDDYLLNPGQPLGEAVEVAKRLPERVDALGREFLGASTREQRKKRRWRTGAIAALAISAIASAGMAHTAYLARERADAREREAHELVDYMLVDLGDALRKRRDLSLLEGVADKSLHYLQQRLVETSNHNGQINRSKAFRTLGEVLSKGKEHRKAMDSFRSADEAISNALALHPDNPEVVKEAAQVAFYIGNEFHGMRQFDEAEAEMVRYAKYGAQLAALVPRDHNGALETSFALNSLGTIKRDRGHYESAILLFERSMMLKRLAARMAPDRTELLYSINDTDSWISSAKEAMGDLESAATGYAHNIAVLRKLIGDDKKARDQKYQLALYMQLDAKLALIMGRLDRAQASNQEAYNILDALADVDPEDMQWKGSLGESHLIAAEIAYARSDTAGALKALAESSTIAQAQLKDEPEKKPRWRRLKARIEWFNALIRGDVPALSRTVDTLEALLKSYPNESHILPELSEALITRAWMRMERGDIDLAASDCARLDELLSGHSRSGNVRLIAPWLQSRRLLTAMGRTDEHSTTDTEAWLVETGYRRDRLPPFAHRTGGPR